MSLSATSRIPVEIWESILRMVVIGMEVLNPDPYDVPAAKLLAASMPTRSRSLDQYKDYMAQILQLRLVCKSWDHFAHPFVDLVTSVHLDLNDQIDRNKVAKFPLYPLCGCRFGASCETCQAAAVSLSASSFTYHLENKEDLVVKILQGFDESNCAL
jgi:hypothetical protein